MRVLIVGLGSIARKHLKALTQIEPTLKIFALRSNKPAIEENGIHNIYDWKEMSSLPGFILISNPTKFHKDAILKGLDFNCPLFIEKPVLASIEDGDEILQKLINKNTITYVACNLRFHPCIKFLKEYLEIGKHRILEVNIYCGSNLKNWRPGTDYSESYSAKAALGGGVHLDLIHEIDYCYWLFGKPIKHFSLKRKVSDLEIDSDDFAHYIFQYPGFTSIITLNYYREHPKRSIEILTDKGVINADLLKGDVFLDNEKKLFGNSDFKMEDTYLEQMKYFIDHIITGKPINNDFKEAFEVLKLATT